MLLPELVTQTGEQFFFFFFFLSLPRLVIRCLIKNFNFSRKLTNKQNTKSCDTGFGAAHQRCFKGSRRSRPPLLLHSRTRDRPDVGTRREAHFSWSKAPCDGGEFRQPANVFFFFPSDPPKRRRAPLSSSPRRRVIKQMHFFLISLLCMESQHRRRKGEGRKAQREGGKCPREHGLRNDRCVCQRLR